WLFCHVCLAFAMRTERVPLSKVGVFSSRQFNAWMAGVILFLAVALFIPVLRDYLKLASVSLASVLLIALGAIVMTSWIEVTKQARWYSEKQEN
ncbi:MAG: cation transporting ATPase C-terminal domain-containing protein, partial [Spirochaetaceae bacterium]|nr:cation transporting ATPase C-terminal domain-containing protein [Spirochaetaceae bacterium]